MHIYKHTYTYPICHLQKNELVDLRINKVSIELVRDANKLMEAFVLYIYCFCSRLFATM